MMLMELVKNNTITKHSKINKMKQEFKDYWAELGWGDRLEWLFRKTGIKWVVKKINPNCNCDIRQHKLNEFEIKIKRK